MIKGIKINDNKNRLLIDGLDNFGRLNILMGGNGVGKSTLLEYLELGLNGDSKYKLDGKLDNIVLHKYVNSEHNFKRKNYEMVSMTRRDFVHLGFFGSDSEGEVIVRSFNDWLDDISDDISDKNVEYVFLLDEIDSGLSTENINLICHNLYDLVKNNENVQIFITANNYHFAYFFKQVIWLYDGKKEMIKDYDTYFKRYSEGKILLLDRDKRLSKGDFTK